MYWEIKLELAILIFTVNIENSHALIWNFTNWTDLNKTTTYIEKVSNYNVFIAFGKEYSSVLKFGNQHNQDGMIKIRTKDGSSIEKIRFNSELRIYSEYKFPI